MLRVRSTPWLVLYPLISRWKGVLVKSAPGRGKPARVPQTRAVRERGLLKKVFILGMGAALMISLLPYPAMAQDRSSDTSFGFAGRAEYNRAVGGVGAGKVAGGGSGSPKTSGTSAGAKAADGTRLKTLP